MKKSLLLSLVVFCSLHYSNIQAQTYITIGTNEITTGAEASQFLAVTAADFKHQIIVLSSEITSGGGELGDSIIGLQWYVSSDINSAPITYDLYVGNYGPDTVPMAVVFAAAPSTQVGSGLIDTGLVDGWHTAMFNQPFIWDGSSNLLFQVCREESAETGNDAVAVFNDTKRRAVTGLATLCNESGATFRLRTRPYMRLVIDDGLTGLDIPVFDFPLKLFPMPISRVLNIGFGGQAFKGSADMLSLNGALIQHQLVNGETAEMDLSDMAPGVYLLKLTADSGATAYRKVVKN